MEYIGDGNWECPKCGRVIPFGESDDDDDGESLSVYDAALIWASNGKDEGYTFGYSEGELERALRWPLPVNDQIPKKRLDQLPRMTKERILAVEQFPLTTEEAWRTCYRLEPRWECRIVD